MGELGAFDKPKPIDRLADLLCRYEHLVGKVGSTLGTACFRIVRTPGGPGARELASNVFRRRIGREFADDTKDSG